jgi:geranylgeranyl pyrophosphate synthase
MNMQAVKLSSWESGLQADGLADLWDYALARPSKQTRSKVLLAAEASVRGGNCEPDARTAVAAQAVETLHLASLAHDDVVDAGEMRRGAASLPAFFGAPLAAAAGALFFGRALNQIVCCGEEAVMLATETAMRMCEGQMRELRSLRDAGRSQREYFEAIEGKTAGMFWLAANLGGLMGGADPVSMSALARYGESLGIAYQIIDDLLDLTGNPDDTGKSHGSDLQNGNYTLPVIYALEECPRLFELLQEEATVEAVIDPIRDTHAIRRTSAEAQRWIEQAKEAVCLLPAARGLLEIADVELGALDDVV